MIVYKTYEVSFLINLLNRAVPRLEKALMKHLKDRTDPSSRLEGSNSADRAYYSIICARNVINVLSKKRMCFSCTKIKPPLYFITSKDFTIKQLLALKEHIVNKSRRGMDHSWCGLINISDVLYDRTQKSTIPFAKIKFLALTCSEECLNIYILQQKFKANTKND